MRDQPQGSVFGGYGFMRYTSPLDAYPGQRQAPSSTSRSTAGFAAAAQRLLARWMRR